MAINRQFRRTAGSCAAIAFATAFFLMVADEHTDAHKPVTSKYEYNKDIFPLLRDHCGSCHVKGGPAPMPLMTYDDAVPWAESIRDELTAGRMPPWPLDPTSAPIKGGYPISSREIDMIVVWASGGTPQGDPEAKLPSVPFDPHWTLGPPDLKIPMDVEHALAPGTVDDTSEFSLPVDLRDTKWLKAADLMPGTASIVRNAVISIENGPVLALWEPGGDTTAAPSGAAFKLSPGSKIHLQIHYKKHFDQEQSTVSDKSTIGLYFTDPPLSGHEMQSLAIDAPDASGDASSAATFTGTLPGNARVVALRPMLDRAYQTLTVDAITPSGTRVPLLRLHGPRPQWFRRYWLQEPVELAGGSVITVGVTPLSDYSDDPKVAKRIGLQVTLDYIPQ
jgi:hypothetical protein